MPGSERRVYIGNLPSDVRTRDLEDLFDKFGTIISTDLKAKGDRRSPFAFIEFEDPRDAEDAVNKRNGYNFDGYRIRVEFPRGGRSDGSGGDGPRHGGGGGARSRYPKRRSVYRVLVSGLPPTGSWQDLKDHFREAGNVCFADVKDGHGVVEFKRYEDMKYAVTKMDHFQFRSHEGDSSLIRVKEDRSRDKSRSRSRSYSPVRRRRDTRSPRVRRNPRSRSGSRSLSRSPARR